MVRGGVWTRKPLPLKQRTSSVDPRRDFSTQTWTSLLGLLKFREYLVTVDHFSIWRRHLAWGMGSGEDLRDHISKRYSTSMVFMSLLLGTELNVLFTSAEITTEVRNALVNQDQFTIPFWIGILIILSAILTLLSLISTFTAWGMVSAIHKENAYCVLRSSIGQYAAELPGRLIVSSIYVFLCWVVLFIFIVMPVGAYSAVLLCFAIGLFIHTITAFSSFGRIIMHSGAMGRERIFDPDFEKTLTPHMLHQNLLTKARVYLDNNISIRRQYGDKRLIFPLQRTFSEEELAAILMERASLHSDLISPLDVPSDQPPNTIHRHGSYAPRQPQADYPPPSARPTLPTSNSSFRNLVNPAPMDGEPRPRSNSIVKFSDGFDTTGNRVDVSEVKHQRSGSTGGVMRGAIPSSPGSKRNLIPKNVPKLGTTKGSSGNGSAPDSASPSASQQAPTTEANQSSIGFQANRMADNVTNLQYQQQWQQLSVPPLHHAALPPQGRQFSRDELSPGAHERWLAGAYGANNNTAYPYQPQLQPQLQLAVSSTQSNPYSYNFPMSTQPLVHYSYNHFNQEQQQYPGANSYYQIPHLAAPDGITYESRGISSGSIPSQVGLERRDSLVSELDHFQHFHGDDIEEDNVASYNDQDIDELLDPPSFLDHRSNNSVTTMSTRGSEDKNNGSLLAGLAIEAGDGDDDHCSASESGQPLLQHSKHHQYLSFSDEIKEDAPI